MLPTGVRRYFLLITSLSFLLSFPSSSFSFCFASSPNLFSLWFLLPDSQHCTCLFNLYYLLPLLYTVLFLVSLFLPPPLSLFLFLLKNVFSLLLSAPFLPFFSFCSFPSPSVSFCFTSPFPCGFPLLLLHRLSYSFTYIYSYSVLRVPFYFIYTYTLPMFFRLIALLLHSEILSFILSISFPLFPLLYYYVSCFS